MPKITNKRTGKTEVVTQEQLDRIKQNPMTKNLFYIQNTPVPEEVKKIHYQSPLAETAPAGEVKPKPKPGSGRKNNQSLKSQSE